MSKSKLEKFTLYFEYDHTLHEIKKNIKIRTNE